MSSQRGNISRTRKQKHNNKTAFKNNLHDTSRRTQQINNLEITEVCKRCQDVIAWKVKYKKYKPLTQPKTCTRCHQKNIKDAYHIVCLPCAKELQVCCKCGKREEIVAHKSPSKIEQLQTMAELEVVVKSLSERKRRSYYRYLEKLDGKKKRKKKPAVEPEGEGEGSEGESETEKEEERAVNLDEYFKKAQQKLEQLMKGMEDGEFYEDLEDLNLSSEEEFDDEEEDESDND